MPSLFDGMEPQSPPIPPVLEVGDRVKVAADVPQFGDLTGDVVARLDGDRYHVRMDRHPCETREWSRGYLVWVPR